MPLLPCSHRIGIRLNPTTPKTNVISMSGKDDATEMGNALRRLNILIGEVLSSPTYRTLETARYAKLPDPRTAPELGENGASMQGVTAAQAEWLRNHVKEFPNATNTLLVTHYPT